MTSKKETDIVRKAYNYFKAARSELAFLATAYTAWRVTYTTFTWANVLQIGALLIGGILIGYVSRKYLDTTNAYTNPFTQDYIKFRIHFIDGMIHDSSGEYKEAIVHYTEARNILAKWVD